MALWMVRAGRYGEQEETALSKGVVTIGWNDLPDLSHIKTKEELEKIYLEIYPEEKRRTVANQVGQIFRFIKEIKKGDLVAIPLKTQSAIAIGEVKGDYEYEKLAENVMHIRRVKWIKTIPRTYFDQDLLYSFGAIMTVCNIERNDAEERIKKMLKGKPATILPPETGEEIDIEEYAKDQIVKYIDRKFKGHNFTRLINAILKAQGYTTIVSPPGADGGIDILASAGPLGFNSPKICVQVKSQSAPVNVNILRELKGAMGDAKAEQGLLVSWSGFNTNVEKKAKNDFFTIRFWDSGDIIDEIFKHYEKFDDEIKAELPLKRIWTLVPEGS